MDKLRRALQGQDQDLEDEERGFVAQVGVTGVKENIIDNFILHLRLWMHQHCHGAPGSKASVSALLLVCCVPY